MEISLRNSVFFFSQLINYKNGRIALRLKMYTCIKLWHISQLQILYDLQEKRNIYFFVSSCVFWVFLNFYFEHCKMFANRVWMFEHFHSKSCFIFTELENLLCQYLYFILFHVTASMLIELT